MDSQSSDVLVDGVITVSLLFKQSPFDYTSVELLAQRPKGEFFSTVVHPRISAQDISNHQKMSQNRVANNIPGAYRFAK